MASLGFGLYGWVAPPDQGLKLELSSGAAVVESVHPASEFWLAGVRPGDTLLFINGAPVPLTAADIPRPVNTFSARSTTTGEMLQASPRSDAADDVGVIASLIVISLAFALMSVFVFARAHRPPDAISFSWLGLAAGAALAIAPAALSGHIWGLIAQGATIAATSVLFFGFFQGFAAARPFQSPLWQKIYPEIYAGIVVVLLIPWILAATIAPELQTLLKSLRLLLLLGAVGGGIGMLLYGYWRNRSATAREQMRIVTVGTTLGVLPFIWLSVIPLILTNDPILRPETSVIGVVLIPLSIGYAVLRHQLMGLRRLVHRSTAYALISVGIIVLYSASLMTVHGISPESGPPAWVELAFLVLLFTGVPLLAGVRRGAFAVVDRILYKEVVDHRDIIRSASMSAGSGTDVPRLARRVLKDVVDALGLEFGAYIQTSPGSPSIVSGVGAVPMDLPRAATSGYDAPMGSGMHTWTVNMSEIAGPILVGPVRGLRDLSGLLALGPRRTGDSFDADDVRMFQTVCGVVTTALARAQLLEEVQRQSDELSQLTSQLQNVQEEERSAISSYLHDEPLQKVAYAVARLRERSLAEDLAGLLEGVERDLRNTSATLSPEMLREFGMLRALEWLTAEIGRQAQFKVEFSTHGISAHDRFNPDVELVAYRTVQEALTNCRKHSQAQSVWVNLSVSEGHLCILVEDDGVGLTKSAVIQDREVSSGLGLRAMRQRIGRLGGELSISPRRPGGTTVDAYIPLNPTNPTEMNTEAAD